MTITNNKARLRRQKESTHFFRVRGNTDGIESPFIGRIQTEQEQRDFNNVRENEETRLKMAPNVGLVEELDDIPGIKSPIVKHKVNQERNVQVAGDGAQLLRRARKSQVREERLGVGHPSTNMSAGGQGALRTSGTLWVNWRKVWCVLSLLGLYAYIYIYIYVHAYIAYIDAFLKH